MKLEKKMKSILIISIVYFLILNISCTSSSSSAPGAAQDSAFDTSNPTKPGEITIKEKSTDYLNRTPKFLFMDSTDNSGSVDYQVEIRKDLTGAVVKEFTLANGNGSEGVYLDGLSLEGGELYFVNIRSIDTSGNKSESVKSTSWSALNCGSGLVEVPPLTPYTTKYFCVFKFEAKIKDEVSGNQVYNSAFVAESRATGTPWTDISRDQAKLECEALGSGFTLITNNDWQTIARNIESVSSNWAAASNGELTLYRGHVDNSPAQALAITDVSDFYNGTGDNQYEFVGQGKEQRRVFTLSNGETIWDLAGNVYEMVLYDNNFTYGGNAFFSQNPASFPTSDPGGYPLFTRFGPSKDYSGTASTEKHGLGAWGYAGTGVGTIIRGGNYNSSSSGVFSTYAGQDDSTRHFPEVGFRCVFHP